MANDFALSAARNHRILARVYEMLDLPDKAFQHWEDALKFYEEYENGLRGVTTTSQVKFNSICLLFI